MSAKYQVTRSRGVSFGVSECLAPIALAVNLPGGNSHSTNAIRWSYRPGDRWRRRRPRRRGKPKNEIIEASKPRPDLSRVDGRKAKLWTTVKDWKFDWFDNVSDEWPFFSNYRHSETGALNSSGDPESDQLFRIIPSYAGVRPPIRSPLKNRQMANKKTQAAFNGHVGGGGSPANKYNGDFLKWLKVLIAKYGDDAIPQNEFRLFLSSLSDHVAKLFEEQLAGDKISKDTATLKAHLRDLESYILGQSHTIQTLQRKIDNLMRILQQMEKNPLQPKKQETPPHRSSNTRQFEQKPKSSNFTFSERLENVLKGHLSEPTTFVYDHYRMTEGGGVLILDAFTGQLHMVKPVGHGTTLVIDCGQSVIKKRFEKCSPHELARRLNTVNSKECQELERECQVDVEAIHLMPDWQSTPGGKIEFTWGGKDLSTYLLKSPSYKTSWRGGATELNWCVDKLDKNKAKRIRDMLDVKQSCVAAIEGLADEYDGCREGPGALFKTQLKELLKCDEIILGFVDEEKQTKCQHQVLKVANASTVGMILIKPSPSEGLVQPEVYHPTLHRRVAPYQPCLTMAIATIEGSANIPSRAWCAIEDGQKAMDQLMVHL